MKKRCEICSERESVSVSGKRKSFESEGYLVKRVDNEKVFERV